MKRLKIPFHRPCINNCFAEFVPKDNSIYYGLSAIKSVGLESISLIVKEISIDSQLKILHILLVLKVMTNKVIT